LALAAIDTLLGRLLADAGRREEAVQRLQEAITAAAEEQADPLAARAYDALAQVLDSVGRADEAKASREMASRLSG
jgi:Flp pilus assembly protein TadD